MRGFVLAGKLTVKLRRTVLEIDGAADARPPVIFSVGYAPRPPPLEIEYDRYRWQSLAAFPVVVAQAQERRRVELLTYSNFR